MHWKELSIHFFFFFLLCSAHPVDAALLPNEWHSSGSLSIAILQCIIAANTLRIDLCLYKNTSGGNHHIGNKWMLIWLQGQSRQMPGRLFIYFIYVVLREGSSAVQSISVQSLLFSKVIKESIDLLAVDSYLLPPPPVLCFVLPSGPRGEKLWSQKLKACTLPQHNAHSH